MAIDEEKQAVEAQHVEDGNAGRRRSSQIADPMVFDTERAPEARGRDLNDLPFSYWYSPMFLGSFCAIGLGFAAACGGFALIAPLLGVINADIGPSDNIIWVALVFLLTQASGFLIVGRLTDIFGRRWFFIVGSLIGLVGSILGATAQNVNQLIGAEVFIGIAGSFQVSFFWVSAELVPMKYRYIASSFAYAMTLPTNPMAAKVAITIQTQTKAGWRGCFYLCIGLNAASALCWYLFYHPPTFKMLHRRTVVTDLLKRFDWFGLLMYTGAILIFLMGLNWGGALYPWSDPHVVGVLVGGAILFILFILWEIFLPKFFPNLEPFLPLHLFTNIRYMACAWLTAIGAATYFGFSLIWPQCVAVLYDLSDSSRATISGLAAMGFVFGQIVGGFVVTYTGPRPGIIVTMTIAAPLLMAAAANPLNMNLTMGLVASGTLFVGAMEGMSIASTTFPLRTQEEIGTAGGLSGSIRSFGSVIAIAILTTTLRTRLKTTIPGQVIPAAIAAGLPPKSVESLLGGFSGITPLDAESVPGLTDSILTVASAAYKKANSDAFSTVFLVSFAFGGIGMILCWFVAQNDASLDNFVAGHIHKTSEEKAMEEEAG